MGLTPPCCLLRARPPSHVGTQVCSCFNTQVWLVAGHLCFNKGKSTRRERYTSHHSRTCSSRGTCRHHDRTLGPHATFFFPTLAGCCPRPTRVPEGLLGGAAWVTLAGLKASVCVRSFHFCPEVALGRHPAHREWTAWPGFPAEPVGMAPTSPMAPLMADSPSPRPALKHSKQVDSDHFGWDLWDGQLAEKA